MNDKIKLVRKDKLPRYSFEKVSKYGFPTLVCEECTFSVDSHAEWCSKSKRVER